MSVNILKTIAKSALALGPNLLRNYGHAQPVPAAAGIILDIADYVEEAKIISDGGIEDQEDLLSKRLDLEKFSPEQLTQAMTTINELYGLYLDDKYRKHEITQKTILAGDNNESEFVRNTRPLMARLSCIFTLVYLLAFSLLQAFGKGAGPQLDIAALISSYAWAYLGVRTLDGFAPHSKNGSKISGAVLGAINAVIGKPPHKT